MRTKAVLNWSGGKDSSLCLHRVLQQGEYDVACLLTTVNCHYNRVSMHGVRVELLERQAHELSIPLIKVLLPEVVDMRLYEATMVATLQMLKEQGVEVSIYGDIFLQELRNYREEQLKKMDVRARFPLWQASTRDLVWEFLRDGFQAIVTCVDARFLDKSFVGRIIDEKFLNDLPSTVDPCGEHGEFHSFVYDGPLFKSPIRFQKGEVVYRTYKPAGRDGTIQRHCYGVSQSTQHPAGFWFCDLLPVQTKESS